METFWYEKVSTETLEQGDVLFDFPVLIASLTPKDISVLLSGEGEGYAPEETSEVVNADVVVMTQTCDLENDKVESVLLCPVWRETDMKANKGEKESIRRGYRPGWHLLGSDDTTDIPLLFVEFTRIHTSPKETVSAFARGKENRPRLCSPYKEHLSQAFARFFMRVGLPSSIPSFK